MKARLSSFFLLIPTLLIAACSSEQTDEPQAAPIRPAKIVKAFSESRSAKRSYPGVVEASVKSDLAFRVGGQLQVLNANPGMNFKQGDVLAQLDSAEYENILADRRAKFALARSQYGKIKELFDKQYVSPSEVDLAEADLKAAEAALSSAEDNVRYTSLRAPFDGVVAFVSAENHQSVGANESIIQFQNTDSLDIRYSVPESLMGAVKPVEDPSQICAQVRFNAHPQETYKACFKEFESIPDQFTRSYSVVHTMPKISAFQVLPGMAVTVEIDLTDMLLETLSGGAFVPIEAVYEKAGQTFVWKVREDFTVTATPVSVGPVRDGFLFISAGIADQDLVVAAGVSYLQEGQKVKPLTKERGL